MITHAQEQMAGIRQAIYGGPTIDVPVSETPQTIAYQIQWLLEGKRKAVFFPLGSFIPELPKAMRAFLTEKGTFYFNPSMTGEDDIQKAVKENKIGDILEYGISEKPPLFKIIGAVVIRSKEGIEKQAVAFDQENYNNIIKASRLMTDKGDTITLEPIQQIINERMKL